MDLKLDQHFMEIAFRASLDCINPGEHAPKIAAVLVRDGKVLATAYRAESGYKRHAEEIVLAKARGQSEGATLYATVEPCSFRRSEHKSCLALIQDAGIKRVVIGMRDPDPKMQTVELLQQAGIKVEWGVLQGKILHLNKDFYQQYNLLGEFERLMQSWNAKEIQKMERNEQKLSIMLPKKNNLKKEIEKIAASWLDLEVRAVQEDNVEIVQVIKKERGKEWK